MPVVSAPKLDHVKIGFAGLLDNVTRRTRQVVHTRVELLKIPPLPCAPRGGVHHRDIPSTAASVGTNVQNVVGVDGEKIVPTAWLRDDIKHLV